jgi:hypothetical protein
MGIEEMSKKLFTEKEIKLLSTKKYVNAVRSKDRFNANDSGSIFDNYRFIII